MENHKRSRSGVFLTIGGTILGIFVGAIGGLLVGVQPLLLGLALFAGGAVAYFFSNFEQAVIGLLIVRSALDIFSDYQLPAAFALGAIGLTMLYVTVRLLTGQSIRTDGFWWCLLLWLGVQSLWVILLPLGGLGFDGSYLSSAIREWVRLFSWLIVYLLVMQLKDRIPPQKVISLLFLGLLAPLSVAALQILLPPSVLPSFLVYGSGSESGLPFEVGARINGTLGHPNTFTTFLFLFFALSYWKQAHANPRKPWLIVLGLVAFFFVSTKALFGLMMLATFIFVFLAPRLNITSLLGGILLFALIIGLFGSTEFGQERLGSIAETPLLNPNMEVWRAILLSQGDGNSFNWRLAQWNYLLEQWQDYPLLGFGLGTNKYISANGLEPHNDYIRALVEGGIIGFVTFLGFIIAQIVRLLQLFRHAPRGSAQRDLCWTLIAVVIGVAVGMITENIWTHTTLFFYWFTVLAVAGWDWQEQAPSGGEKLREVAEIRAKNAEGF